MMRDQYEKDILGLTKHCLVNLFLDWGGGGDQSVSRVCASVGTNGAVGINTCLCYTLPAISIHNTHQEPARAAGTGLVN